MPMKGSYKRKKAGARSTYRGQKTKPAKRKFTR